MSSEGEAGHGQHQPRAIAALALVNVWGCRLLHNYFRREGWHFGLGEDWRYVPMQPLNCSHNIWSIVSVRASNARCYI